LHGISDLRSAFLICVARFGYSYGFSTALKDVLKQVTKPNELILDRWWFDNHPDAKQNTIAVAQQDGMVLVTFGGHITFLPWPTHSIEHYRDMMRAIVEKRRITLSNAVRVSWPTSFEALFDHEN
jgi:hypothetical protein